MAVSAAGVASGLMPGRACGQWPPATASSIVMATLIDCTVLLVLGTKALDCLSTLRAIRTPEAEGFGDAQARAVEQQQHGRIASRDPVAIGAVLDERTRLLDG